MVTYSIPMAGFPVLSGHAGVDIFTEVRPGAEDIAPGDHMVLSFIPSGEGAPSCQTDLRNLCDLGASLLGGTPVSDGKFRIQSRGQNVYSMPLLGRFPPYMVVHRRMRSSPERYIFAIDPVEWKRDQNLKRDAPHVCLDINAALMGVGEGHLRADGQKVVISVDKLEGADIDSYLSLAAKGDACVLTAIGSLIDTQVNANLTMLTLSTE